MTGTPEPKDTLPADLPILPLCGALLLPKARLPLNIYEPHYIAMVEESLSKGRMIGLIQPTDITGLHTPTPLYSVGCAGRIISFAETEDHRFLLTLQGVCRFEVLDEKTSKKGFRIIQPEWKNYITDLNLKEENAEIDRTKLSNLLRSYFTTLGLNADWEIVLSASNDELISSLAMLCPLAANEKQALLEAPTQIERAKLLISLLEMACLNKNSGERARH